jgi:hypothetical protein
VEDMLASDAIGAENGAFEGKDIAFVRMLALS